MLSAGLAQTAGYEGAMDELRSHDAALLVYSAVNACKFGLAFQIADDILDWSAIPMLVR
jgi:geranylgeranyl pyrophosphate synthase